MSVLRAYVLPHPPLAVPAVGRGAETKIQKTLDSMNEAADEIAVALPETIIFITPHSSVYKDYFHISPNGGAIGGLSRFGAVDTVFETEYDVDLAKEIIIRAAQNGIPAGFHGETDASLDHGVTVPMWFINRKYTNYKSIRISQSGLNREAHFALGRCIAEAAERLGRRTVLIASGDLSHKLSESGPYGYAHEGAEFDTITVNALQSGDFAVLASVTDSFRESAAECGFNSVMVLSGCLSGLEYTPKLLSYEGPFGVGYAVASFEIHGAKANVRDEYVELAKKSLEYFIENRQPLPLPDGLPPEMTQNKAGVFVSLHISGDLRGCIGTISPTLPNIALEIIQNAVSAGTADPRFPPVTAAELPLLKYKVDVLSAPEPIQSTDELDVKRYGVIVTSGYRRGLLLPNLDGIDTVREQVSIAMRKAGIPSGEQVRLERFEVIRHE
jgi:AmmeMemoRadiSam system protein A